MKKRVFALAALLLTVCLALGIVSCKKPQDEDPVEEPTRIEYEGVYRVNSIRFGDLTLNLGESNLILGNLTRDVAVLTLGENGTLTFKCKLLIVSFDVTGTWTADETNEETITAVIQADEGSYAEILATCNGETLVITYEGVTFTLTK